MSQCDQEYHNLVILSETWTKKENHIIINYFHASPAHRTEYKNDHSRQARGGVILYVREKFLDGVTVLKVSSDLIWVKLDHNFFGFENDIIVCGFYISPSNSSSQANIDIDVLDQMMIDLPNHKAAYPDAYFILGGDGNGRVSNLPDYIINDENIYLPVPDDYECDLPPAYERINEDTIVNTQGRRIIDFCKMSNLRIVNGRTNLGPKGSRYTCLTNRGCSTVDLML